MTQDPKHLFNAQRTFLLCGVIAVVGTVGFVAWRQQQQSAPIPASSSTVNPGMNELASRAAATPDQAKGWRELAQAQFDGGDYAAAAASLEKATAAKDATAPDWSALGEARVMASRNDPMPAAAVAAFQRAIAIDPKDPRARYFLAVQKDLNGDHKGAIADWITLLRETPVGAPWEADLRRTIEQVGKINTIDVNSRLAEATAARPQPAPIAARAIPGPSMEQMAQATGIPPGEQRNMAEGMVASLEAKLKANPANVTGWLMLIRSRTVLNQPDRARAALDAAVAANPAQAQRLRDEAAAIGVR